MRVRAGGVNGKNWPRRWVQLFFLSLSGASCTGLPVSRKKKTPVVQWAQRVLKRSEFAKT